MHLKLRNTLHAFEIKIFLELGFESMASNMKNKCYHQLTKSHPMCLSLDLFRKSKKCENLLDIILDTHKF